MCAEHKSKYNLQFLYQNPPYKHENGAMYQTCFSLIRKCTELQYTICQKKKTALTDQILWHKIRSRTTNSNKNTIESIRQFEIKFTAEMKRTPNRSQSQQNLTPFQKPSNHQSTNINQIHQKQCQNADPNTIRHKTPQKHTTNHKSNNQTS